MPLWSSVWRHLVDVETNEPEAGLRGRECQRQANVTHAHDANGVVSRRDAPEKRFQLRSARPLMRCH